MANVETEFSPAYWVEPRRVVGDDDDIAVYEDAALNSVANLRAALTAADATYYTTDRLDQMTKNDMNFALRHSLGVAVLPTSEEEEPPPPPPEP